MRTGTAFVENAKPVVTVSFFILAGTQVGSTYSNSNRVVYINKKEEPYTGKATIHLLNEDGALDALDFLGCITAITWGWSTGTASTDEPMWVTDQRFISVEGKLVLELKLLNAWELMEHSKGINVADDADMVDTSYGSTRIFNRDTPILDIIESIIQATGSFLEQWGLDTITTIAAEPAGSGAIQTYEPLFVSRLNDDDRTLLRRLLQMTESVITFRASTGLTLNWIDDSLPGPYYTYENDGVEHPFFINISGAASVVPNRIIVVDQEPNIQKAEVANFVGVAELATFPLGQFGIVVVDPTVEDDTEAEFKANKILSRLIKEAELGQMHVPMNCVAELYDEIEIIDNRSGNTYYSRVGQIERTFIAVGNGLEDFNSQRESYVCDIHLGGMGGGSTRIASHAGGVNDIETTISDFKGRSVVNPFIDTPQIDASVLSQHLSPRTFYVQATGNTDYTSGTLADITGATITLDLLYDSVLKLNVVTSITNLTVPAAGDVFAVSVDRNGTPVNGIIARVVGLAGELGNGHQSRMWLLDLPAGSNTIKLQGQRLVGATNWRVQGGSHQTAMIGEIINPKNVTGAQ